MKCEKCGRETEEKICEECREKQNENTAETSDEELLNQTIDANASEVTETVETLVEEPEPEPIIAGSKPENDTDEGLQVKDAAMVISMFIIPRILTLIALICLLFPLMKITYGGQLNNISGKDLIFGGSSISLKEHDSVEYEEDGDMFNWFVMLAAVAAVGALVARSREAYKCGTAAAIFMIIFRVTAKIYYQIGDMSIDEYEINGWMKVQFSGTLYLVIALLLAASGMYFGVAKLKHMKLNDKNWKIKN